MRQIYQVLLALSMLASMGFSQPAAATAPASIPTWESIGPYAISWVKIAQSNSQFVYAFSRSYTFGNDLKPLYTLFGSSDGGQHWMIVKGGLASGVALVIDPTNPNVLYTYLPDTIQSILRSTDGGQTWNPFVTPQGLPIGTFSINPGNPLYMYIGSYSSHQYVSTDGGQIWSMSDCYIWSCEYLTFSPDNPQIVYGLGWNSELDKSTDGGQHWVNKSTGLPFNLHIRGPLINPHNSAQMFVRSLDTDKVYISTNAGDLWEETTLFDPYAFDPGNAQIFYKLDNGQIYRTTDGGTSWVAITDNFPLGIFSNDLNGAAPAKMIIDPADPARLYCVTSLGLYRSSDRGDTWQLLGVGYGSGTVNSLAVAKGEGPMFATLTEVQVLQGDRSGKWVPINLGVSASYYVAAADPKDAATAYIAAKNFGVYKTTNSGADWTLKDSGMSNKVIQTLVVSNFSSSTLYAGAWYNSLTSELGGVYKSIDGGDNWNISRAGMDNPNTYTIAQHPTDPNTLYIGTNPINARMFKSIDGGASWNDVHNGLPNQAIRSVVVDPFQPEMVYAATYGAGVYKTINGGASWSAINTGITDLPLYTYTLAADPTVPGTLYVGTSSGVFRSVNSGMSWAKLGAGLPTGVFCLLLDPNDPHTLYAGSLLFGVFVIHLPYPQYLPLVRK